MRGLNAEGLIGRIYTLDHGVKADGLTDDARAIQAAIEAGRILFGSAGGSVVLPPGVVAIGSTVRLHDNQELEIPSGCTLQLLPGANSDMIANADQVGGNTRVRVTGGGVVDGNRANQGAGNWHGIHLVAVEDARVDAGLTVQSCRGCGVLLSGCTRAEGDLVATDNGIDGVDLLDTVRSVIRARAYDNCKVAAAGSADGIHMEGASTDNIVVASVCYDTLGAGGRQGYGVREDAASTCDRNLIVGGSLEGNLTGAVSLIGASSRLVDTTALTNPMTTEGDLIVGAVGGTPARLARGAALQHLRVNAAGNALEFGDAAPTDYPYLGFGSSSGLSAEVDVQSLGLMNEIPWPPYVADDTDIKDVSLWLRKIGTPTSIKPETGAHGRHAEIVAAAAGDGASWTLTLANEPRVNTVGDHVSSGLWVRITGAGRTATLKVRNSDGTEVSVNLATVGSWEQVSLENLALAGTSVALSVTLDGAGTVDVVPSLNIGAKAFYGLPPRSTRWVDSRAIINAGFDPGGGSVFTDVDIAALTSSLTRRAYVTFVYTNVQEFGANVMAQRKGAAGTPIYVGKGYMSGNTPTIVTALIPLNDGQVFQVGTDAQAASAETLAMFLAGYEEFA